MRTTLSFQNHKISAKYLGQIPTYKSTVDHLYALLTSLVWLLTSTCMNLLLLRNLVWMYAIQLTATCVHTPLCPLQSTYIHDSPSYNPHTYTTVLTKICVHVRKTRLPSHVRPSSLPTFDQETLG
jgi:hypothetical protein